MEERNNQESLEFLKEIADRASQVVFACDVDSHRLTYLSPAFEQVWERSVESVTTNPGALLETIHPEDRRYISEAYKDLIKGEAKKDIEFRIQPSDKSVRWVRASPFFIKQESGKRIVAGFLEDVTAWKIRYAEVKRLLAKKNSVLEILSHDLAEPLNSINGISALMAKHSEENCEDPELDKMIEVIEKTSRRSIRLIQEFIAQESFESDSELIKRRVNIVEKLEEIISQYKNSEKDIAKEFFLESSSESIFVKLDYFKLSLAINNLISNAIKFTQIGGKIKLGIEERQDTILIKVKDNGIGIPAKYKEVLFEKFTKARRPGIKGEPSVGLGMSIIKTIVHWHSGRIWFESQENIGTTSILSCRKNNFLFSIPDQSFYPSQPVVCIGLRPTISYSSVIY